MNVLKILLVVMVIVSALAFSVGCVDKPDDVPDTNESDIDETIIEPDVETTEGAEEEIIEIVEEEPMSELPEREPAEQIVWIQYYSFAPKEPVIYVGDTLKWINSENKPMNYKLISEDGLWEDKTLVWNSKFSYTFNESGVFNYSCPGFGKGLMSSVTVVEYNETTAGLYDSTLQKGVVAVD
ncbi:MAG: hypothetical protein KAH86_03725 [Methanosarcinales archaeon]|nr:hypothetical protein [Methanosarcinales archaeon]